MGSGKIQQFEMGKTGVVLDVQPLDPGLPNGFVTAQNATPDLTSSRAGGIRKRKGLQRVGNAPLAGPVLGGIGVPLAIKAVSINSAPIGLGLITPSPASDATGTVTTPIISAPVGTSDGSGATSTGGSTGDPDGIPSNLIPTLFWALRLKSGIAGDMAKSAGWLVGVPNGDGTFQFFHGIGGVSGDVTGYTDSDFMNNCRSKQMPAGQIQLFFSAFCGSPSASAVSGGALLYPSCKYSNPSGGLPIDRLDTTAQKVQNGKALLGFTNANICNLGNALGTATYSVVMSMIAQDDFNLWALTYDDDNASGAKGGRLFWLNPLNGATRLVKTFVGEIPYSLCIHNGVPWVGTVFAAASHGIIYRGTLDPKGTGNVTDMTADHTAVADKVMTLASFQGQLYAGESGAPGKIEVRSALGVWSVSTSIAATALDIFVGSAIEYKGALYVSTNDPTPTKSDIRKFDGTSWTVVKAAFAAPPLTSAWIHNGVLFFGGGGGNTNFQQNLMILSSTDGTSWTDQSASFTDVASGIGLETTALTPLPTMGVVNIPIPVSQ